MPISIIPSEKKTEIKKIICPDCGEKLKGIGLLPDSRVEGLVFRCKKCGAYKAVQTK